MDGFRCQVLSLSYVHSTGFVSVSFNGIFNVKPGRGLLVTFNNVQELQSMQKINPRSESAGASAVR